MAIEAWEASERANESESESESEGESKLRVLGDAGALACMACRPGTYTGETGLCRVAAFQSRILPRMHIQAMLRAQREFGLG